MPCIRRFSPRRASARACPAWCLPPDVPGLGGCGGFQGRNARLTAEHRRRVFGHRIVMLDPFKVVAKQSDTFNPLDFIDKDSPVAIDECRDLARHW